MARKTSTKERVKTYRVTGPGPSTGGEDYFTPKFENARFHFSKKAIFEDQKVIYVGSSD